MNLKKYKLNESLIDALMEVAIICLVLIGTVTFQNQEEKTILMGSMIAIIVVAIVLRIFKKKFTVID